MKGQMFLIAGIVVVVGLIFMKGIYDIYPLFEESRYIRSRNGKFVLNNVNTEYEKIIGLGNNSKTDKYLYDFSNFVYHDMAGLNIFYVYLKTGANESLVIGNFMDKSLNVTISLSSATPSVFSQVIGNEQNKTFEFNPSGDFEVNISYDGKNEYFNVSEKKQGVLFTDMAIDYDDLKVGKTNFYRGYIQ